MNLEKIGPMGSEVWTDDGRTKSDYNCLPGELKISLNKLRDF